MEMKENDFFVDLVEVVLRFRFVALVEMVEVVIPVESVENEKAHWEYQDEDDVHQPTTTEYGFLTESPGV